MCGGFQQIPTPELSHLNVFPQNPWAGFSCEHIPKFINGAIFRTATRLRTGIATLIQNEVPHPTAEGVADPDPLFKTRIVDVVRLGIENIDQIFIVYRKRNPARRRISQWSLCSLFPDWITY